MALNTASMLAVWPVFETIEPLVIFAALNGMANSASFVAMPTAVSRVATSDQTAVEMEMAITDWTGDISWGVPSPKC